MAKRDTILDPRQNLFLGYYIDPKSETFSNALQSALKAGYSQDYAENLTGQMPVWLSEKLGKLKMVEKAERNIDNMLDMETEEPILINKELVVDDNGNPIKVTNAQLMKIKADVSKFTLERQDKGNWGKGEEPHGNTYNLNIFSNEQAERIARRILNNNPTSTESSN